MDVIGSDMLTSLIHAISQSLLIPVIIILLVFILFALINIGGIVSEYNSRKKLTLNDIEALLKSMTSSDSYEEMKAIIHNSDISENYKIAIIKIINNNEFGNETRKAFAAKIIEEEEIKMEKTVEKTDTVVRLGPTIGLMGTLIPMGPGLAALGAGNIEVLAQAIIIAFDTTVLGLSAAAVAYIISRLRKRWYMQDLSNLEVFIRSTLELLEKQQK
jgi:biopolymer transport protein ExbB/TolQ